MKTLAIMQPTYLPWLGYFDLMRKTDHFIFLDNVQFSKQSWQQRNRIKTASGELMLTLPVSYQTGQLITEVKLVNNHNLMKHLKSIMQAYQRAPSYHIYISELKSFYKNAKPNQFLSEFTIQLILWIKKTLNIQTKIDYASHYNLPEDRIKRLIHLCKQFNAEIYLSPEGARDYLTPFIPHFEREAIKVEFHTYTPVEYPQLYPPFIPYLSAIDFIFNKDI